MKRKIIYNDDFLSENVLLANENPEIFNHIHSFMFFEDLTREIVPMRYHYEKYFKVGIMYNQYAPKNASERKRISNVIIRNLYCEIDLRDCSQAMCLGSFIEATVGFLFAYGEAFYEAVCVRDNKGDIVKFEMQEINPLSMKKIFNKFFQIIPKKYAKTHRIKKRIRYIPNSHILHIEIPKELGGKRKLKHILNDLVTIDKFFLKKNRLLIDDGINIFYKQDVKLSEKNDYIKRAKLTKKFGWGQREYLIDNHYVTEYYQLSRYLKMKKAQAYIRREIMFKLNNFLNNDYLYTGLELKIENLKAVEDIDAIIDEMKINKKKSFKKIVDDVDA